MVFLSIKEHLQGIYCKQLVVDVPWVFTKDNTDKSSYRGRDLVAASGYKWRLYVVPALDLSH